MAREQQPLERQQTTERASVEDARAVESAERGAEAVAESMATAARSEPVADQARAVEADLSVDPDELDRRAETMPDGGVGHDAPEEGTQASGLDPRAGDVGELRYDTKPEVEGTDPTDFADAFDEAMAGGDVGGLDGRNDASDYGGSGGGSGEIGGGTDAMGGLQTDLDGSAATLPEETQRKLRELDNQAREAAASGDTEALDEAVRDTEIIHNASYGDDVKSGPTDVTAGSAMTPLGTNEDGELTTTEGQTELAEEYEGTIFERVSKWITGTSTNSERGRQLQETVDSIDATGAPAPATPPNEDRAEGDDALPEHIRDPSQGWGDEHHDRQWDAGQGGGYTDPTDEGGTVHAGDITAYDPDTYTGDPGEPIVGQRVVTGDELDDFDPNAPVYDELGDG